MLRQRPVDKKTGREKLKRTGRGLEGRRRQGLGQSANEKFCLRGKQGEPEHMGKAAKRRNLRKDGANKPRQRKRNLQAGRV